MLRYITMISALLLGAVIIFALAPEAIEQKKKDPVTMGGTVKQVQKGTEGSMPADHAKQAIDCKSCHYCEYPTVSNPCLISCPRTDMVSVHHDPSEGPEIVIMDMLPGEWGAVAFTHKLHAEMAEMSGGCGSCHHYNTTGPVLKCVTCHEPKRNREDISVPDLEAAYHRQCLSCHRQWSRTTDCDYCHFEKGIDADKARKIKMEKYAGKGHPAVLEPERVVYDTDYEKGPKVTFFHDEHVKMFKIDCATCHHDENCMKCHDVRLDKLRTPKDRDYTVKTHKSFDDHHQPCITCHEKDNCVKCHLNTVMERFNHYKITGFDLTKYHDQIACNKCHIGNDYKVKLNSNCISCHSDTFKPGKFNHSNVGFELDELHVELDCVDCHAANNFEVSPKCADCHDDFTYPNKRPGKKLTLPKRN
ncbi:MAG: hypothetical protein CVV22_04995 [Ignavibacteriae bacterium HGW-Ignavibacteriae-1]|nr:MAG: hypothetical protein CVV22_04995 [Ignavibacteriae bacterium HGW-Ignavibacteriae-1]